jgi:(4-O-methyl)-D-glucuronate---lignin esterase
MMIRPRSVLVIFAIATVIGASRASPQTLGPADQPAPQIGNETWTTAHAALIERARKGSIDLYLAGDSITRRWEATHQQNWDANFAGWKAADFGAGGDRTQNLLYRLEEGELDGVHPKVVVLLIGTNNIGFEPVSGGDDALVTDIAKGIKACLDTIHRKAPDAKILLMGITPRNTQGTTALMTTINKVNRRIAAFADGKTIRFLDIGERLADATGKLFEGMTDDGLHLTDKGYQVWADAMEPVLAEWLGPRPK